MKKWINIIAISMVFLFLPVFIPILRNISVSKQAILLSRIKLSIILIIFGIIYRIFARSLGKISFKTSPQFMKRNSSEDRYINNYKSGGIEYIISGVIVAVISLFISLM